MSELSREEELFVKTIGSTEETTFKEFCHGLKDDCPENTKEWAHAFSVLNGLQQRGYIEIHRKDGKTEGFILTDRGADYIRGKMDADRGLLRDA